MSSDVEIRTDGPQVLMVTLMEWRCSALRRSEIMRVLARYTGGRTGTRQQHSKGEKSQEVTVERSPCAVVRTAVPLTNERTHATIWPFGLHNNCHSQVLHHSCGDSRDGLSTSRTSHLRCLDPSTHSLHLAANRGSPPHGHHAGPLVQRSSVKTWKGG